MKKLLWLLLLTPSLYAQQYRGSFTKAFTATGSSQTIVVIGAGISYQQLQWNISGGTASACTVQVDSSTDGSSWSAGGAIAGQSCTANNTSPAPGAAISVNYIRLTISITVATGTPTVTATWTGYAANPNLATAITNGAGNNVIPKSNGTNLVASSLSDDAAKVTGTVPFRLAAGLAATPSYSFAADNTSGVWQPSVNQVALQGGNQDVTVIGGSGVSFMGGGVVFNAGNNANFGSLVVDVPAIRGITKFLTSNYTNATTTFSNVTGLSFAVTANQNYKIRCDLDYQTSATTADIKIQWTGPASPTAVTYDFKADLTATTGATDSVATAFSTSLAGTGTPTITTNLPLRTAMTLINGANAGTVQLQAAATGTGTITIIPGSCVVTQ